MVGSCVTVKCQPPFIEFDFSKFGAKFTACAADVDLCSLLFSGLVGCVANVVAPGVGVTAVFAALFITRSVLLKQAIKAMLLKILATMGANKLLKGVC